MADLSRPGHVPGSSSARGLLFTVLGELALPAGGAVWTSAVIEVLGRLGVEEKAARQALSRVAAGGWISAERHGRLTAWTLTASGRRLLTEGTERIYGFAGLADDWDGRWLLVLGGPAEGDRAVRHVLRTRLAWAGLGSPRQGLWMTTHVDRLDEVREVLDSAGAGDAHVFVAHHVAGGELAAMVAQAWDLDAVAAAYDAFVARFASLSAGDADPLARLVELVHAWRAFPRMDPSLPKVLLPDGWSGDAAAATFADRHREWAAPAGREWRRINGDDR